MRVDEGYIFKVERRMIDPSRWDEVPVEIMERARETIDGGYPTGFAHDPILGWCILGCGQGPFFMYVEREELLP